MTKVVFHEFATKDDMAAALADRTIDVLTAGLARGGDVTWAVSGGSTPKPLFEAVRTRPLDWSRVTIALVDERWVPFDHPRSNEAFMHRELDSGETAQARFMGMYRGAESVGAAADSVAADYAALGPIGPCLLGMGPDGHTASLFPDADGLDAAFAEDAPMVAALTAQKSDVTGEEVDRLTLTADAIAASAWPHLMISGAGKRRALEDALAGASLPIARVAAMLDEPLAVYWAP